MRPEFIDLQGAEEIVFDDDCGARTFGGIGLALMLAVPLWIGMGIAAWMLMRP